MTTLFMPISFARRFFGMNFFQPVGKPTQRWTTSPAFVLAVAVNAPHGRLACTSGFGGVGDVTTTTWRAPH